MCPAVDSPGRDLSLPAAIDHTLLKPEATEAQVRALCKEAALYGFAAVCVNPYWVKLCAQVLADTAVKVCTVVGFPLGAIPTVAKRAETQLAIDDGAQEIDMVMNLGAFKSGDLSQVQTDIEQVVAAASGRATVKVILETGSLNPAEVVQAASLAKQAGADFVKTSTGFAGSGATVEDVALMRATVGAELGVKASGGIRSRQDALAMLAAGASRIGTSSSVSMVSEEDQSAKLAGDEKARAELIEFGSRLWQREYVAASEGNLSIRLGEDRFLVTRTGACLGTLAPEDLVLVDLDGQPIEGKAEATAELAGHLEVFRQRADVEAVVHAHPPYATACAVAGLALDQCVLPEAVVVLGAVPLVPYATPWTDEVPKALKPYLTKCDAVLLANHGAMTWGPSLAAAIDKMEILETTARVTHLALSMGKLSTLDQAAVERLMQLREQKGLPGKLTPCRP